MCQNAALKEIFWYQKPQLPLFFQRNVGKSEIKGVGGVHSSLVDITPTFLYKWTKIWSLEIHIFDIKMLVNGLEFFILKFSEPIQRRVASAQYKNLPREAELA